MHEEFSIFANLAPPRLGLPRRWNVLLVFVSFLAFMPLVVEPASAQETRNAASGDAAADQTTKRPSSDDQPSGRAAGGESTAATPRAPEQSFLTYLVNGSGVIGYIIAVMSFYLIALVVWMALKYRVGVAIPADVVQDVKGLLDQSKYQEAYQRLTTDQSFLSRVLVAGVRKLPSGVGQAQRAMELSNEDMTMEMEHRTTYLATVGTLGPMIGLVGTVYGMILAFSVIAVPGSTPQASELAAGISTALFATLEGIAVSIPAIYFYSLFRNKIARLSLEVGTTAETLLDLFVPGVRPMNMTGPGGPASGAHPHPLAVSAALAAGGAASHASRTSLPPLDPPPAVE